MKTLHFSTVIHAPVRRVWETMFDAASYKDWAAAFCEGTYFEGSWEQGRSIRFLAPGGSGMVAVIDACRPHEFLSIKHLGMVENGVEDTESPAVRAWAPAFENYTFSSDGTSTELRVDIDVAPDWEEYMENTWPQALARLKSLCEAA